MSGQMEGYIIKNGVRTGSLVKYAYKSQADAAIVQVAPVQNTWYPVLAATNDVEVTYISTAVFVANETLEVRITVDGRVITAAVAAVAGTYYYPAYQGDTPNGMYLDVTFQGSRSFYIKGQSVAVAVRKTTILGAGDLACMVKYATLEET